MEEEDCSAAPAESCSTVQEEVCTTEYQEECTQEPGQCVPPDPVCQVGQ